MMHCAWPTSGCRGPDRAGMVAVPSTPVGSSFQCSPLGSAQSLTAAFPRYRACRTRPRVPCWARAWLTRATSREIATGRGRSCWLGCMSSDRRPRQRGPFKAPMANLESEGLPRPYPSNPDQRVQVVG